MRHSEKNFTSNDSSDSPLTECGEQRSEFLSSFLEDIDLEAIYSIDVARTNRTALPTAQSKELEIQTFKDILKSINDSENGEYPGKLRDRQKDVMKGSKNERHTIMEILGCCEILNLKVMIDQQLEGTIGLLLNIGEVKISLM